MRRSAIVPVAVSSATQMGVGTSPPAGNFIETLTALPESVPVSVPLLTLWHDPHVPSEGSTALISAVPDKVLPDCVITHVISSGLNESDPMPVHVPSTTTAPGVDGGGGGAGCGVTGAGTAGLGAVVIAGAIDPHAATHAAHAAQTRRLPTFMCRPLSA